MAEVVPLAFLALLRLQKRQLLLGLHALCDHPLLQASTHGDDRRVIGVEVEERPLEDVPRLITTRVIVHALVVCAFFHAAARGVLRLGS